MLISDKCSEINAMIIMKIWTSNVYGDSKTGLIWKLAETKTTKK